MNKSDVVRMLLGKQFHLPPPHQSAHAFAPTNIALCKYWGKRNQELNLPITSSLSISLGNKGASTKLSISDDAADHIFLHGQVIDNDSVFSKKLIAFLDLFRKPDSCYLTIQIETTIPIAAGLASSACGFAALIKALDELFAWKLPPHQLSILARLGSGSASRSIWPGFVEWHKGEREDGMDSYAQPIETTWPDLCIGLIILSEKEKSLSSREAMQRTVMTSPLYSAWPSVVSRDLALIKQAISNHDIELLGQTAEANALTMHATMLAAWPPILYALPETLGTIQQIWHLRSQGYPVYFTQDAGPNIKLLFLRQNLPALRDYFPDMGVILPFMST